MKTCFRTISSTVFSGFILLGCPAITMAQDNSIVVNPTSLSFCVAASNSPAPPAQTLTVSASGSSAVGFNANAFPSWVVLNGGTTSIVGNTFSAPNITVTINPSGYSAGSNSGLIQINAGNAVNVPVSVMLSSACPNANLLTPAPTSVNLSAAQTSQAVTIGGPSAAQITATPIFGNSNPTGWFSLSSASVMAGQGVTVSLVTPNLPAGTTGSILFSQNGTGNSISVPVSYTSTGGTGNGVFTANPSSIDPSFTTSQTPAQTGTVTIAGPAASLTTTVNLGTGPNGWIAATQPSGPSPTTIQVTLNPATLTTGTTYGAVIVSQPGTGNFVVIPVSATIQTQAYSYSPSPFTFSVFAGSPIEKNQTLTITGPNNVEVVATARVFSGGYQWLTFTGGVSAYPILTNSSVPLQVTVNPSNMASGQTFTGVITVTQGDSTVLELPVTVTTLPYAHPNDFTRSGLSGALLYDPVLGTAYAALSNGNGSHQYVYNLFTAGFDTLRTGDFNGDEKADVVVYNSQTALGYIGLSNGDGTFSFQSLFWSPGFDFVEPGDLNGDGETDFALYNSSNGTLYTAISNGTGGFTYQYKLISPGYTYIRLADFTGSGRAGLFVYNASTGVAFLGIGDGAGGFAFHPLFMSPGYDFLDVGDLNRDGKADIIAYSSVTGNAATGIGDGVSGFEFTPLIFSRGFTAVRLADYMGTGYDGVILYNKNTTAAYFGAGTGFGTFNFHSLFWSLGYDYVVAEDVNDDGKIDFILYNSVTGTEYTGLSNGDGNFTYFYQYWGIGKVIAR